MRARFIALTLAAGLAGCAATDYVPPRPPTVPGPQNSYREVETWKGPGAFGDLTWNIDLSGKATKAQNASNPEEYKKAVESMSPAERQEFEDWRAWQEWKRKNPK